MPLFGKPSFKSTKKVPRRKADTVGSSPELLSASSKEALDTNLDISQTPLQLSLGGQKMLFQEGSWISEKGGNQLTPGEENKERIVALEEENNLLKYKIELLLDMLAVSESDISFMEKEIAQLRKNISGRDSGIS